MFLVKTLKSSEFDILFDDKWLVDYYKFIKENPDSLLSRYFGVYELRINKQTPVQLFITENVIGNDFSAIKRCYDLKGSSHGRFVNLDVYSKITEDTGLKVLKCENFIQDNEKEPVLDINAEIKGNMKALLTKDSLFLKQHGLIDYSIFLVEVDREKMLRNAEHCEDHL